MIIVTGLPRSGTSMMMRCLHKNGVDCLFSNEVTYQIRDQKYHPNPNGYMQTKVDCYDYLVNRGLNHAVKWFNCKELPELSDSFIIVMVRNPINIRNSHNKSFGHVPKLLNGKSVAEKYEVHIRKTVKICKRKVGTNKVVTINYDLVKADPAKEFEKLHMLGKPAGSLAKYVDTSLMDRLVK